MKEIVIVVDHPKNEELLVGILEGLFPECEVRVVYKSSSPGRTACSAPAPNLTKEKRE